MLALEPCKGGALAKGRSGGILVEILVMISDGREKLRSSFLWVGVCASLCGFLGAARVVALPQSELEGMMQIYS